jgi:DNA-binding response OmpR family regulator
VTPKRILLAEDEETIRFIIRLNLGNGFEIVEAADGEEAWGKFIADEDKFDLVIVDWKMPRLRGDELLHRIQKKRPETRAILLTGDLEPPLAPQPHLRILTKPFDNSQLLATVRQLLR